ncbi:hypothetical protein ACHWQZ_G006538 [Mnemiopsis leidyi]
MFRYTVIDVGGDLVVFNKEDGALAQNRRDSWPPRFPTEEELKYDRVRLKTERLERQARLEEDVRRKRVQTINTIDFNKTEKFSSEVTEDREEQSSEDSGIVSFRDEEHTTLTENLTVQINLDPTTEETTETEEPKEKEPSPRAARAPSVTKTRSVSNKSFRTQDAIPTDDVTEGPGDRPYIVAPGRRRAPKTDKKKNSSCCTIL